MTQRSQIPVATEADELSYAARGGARDFLSFREGVTVAVKLVGLLLLTWGLWSALQAVFRILLNVVFGGSAASSFGSGSFWQMLVAQPILVGGAELVLGYLLIRFGDTISGWVMPRR